MKNDSVESIKNDLFIIFGEDFGRHPHALEHLLRPLFLNNEFLWVETIGLRSPKINFYDLKRIAEKIKKWIYRGKKEERTIPENIKVLNPFMIPYSQYQLIRAFNKFMVRKAVNRAIKNFAKRRPITITSVPNACDYVGLFNERLKIYYCVDEFSLWPGLDYELVAKLENKLIKQSDVIIAVSNTLAETKTIANKKTRVLTHGVEFNHFNIGEKKIKNDSFKICYFGLFDERSNQDIIASIANEIKDSEIHIFGNVVCSVEHLKKMKNIFFHGPIQYAKLPSAVQDMDLFILPYYKNELTNFINPLKLKEYLSTGRPVVSIDLPEVIKLKDYLYIARNSDEFIKTISSIKNNKQIFNSDRVINYIRENETWKAKAEKLCEIIKLELDQEVKSLLS